MHHIGTQTIETARLTLRRFAPDDAPGAQRNWLSDAEVQGGYAEPVYATVEAAGELLAGWAADYEKPDFYRWAIILRAGGECVGQIAFYEVNTRHRRADVEYCVGRAYQGRGYAPEALRAVVAYAHAAGFRRVQGFHRADNEASGRVMSKAGMVREGTLRSYINHYERLCDVVMYSSVVGEDGAVVK